MRNRTVLTAALLVATACSSHPPATAPAPAEAPSRDAISADLEDLREVLEARIAAGPGEVAVVVVDLGTGARMGINDDVVMHAASTMKVPVLVELYRQVAEGRFELDDPVDVVTTFTSIADGSAYELYAEDDSERALYRLVGRQVSREDLARRMIVRSSNLATNLLMEDVGAEDVQATMGALGADDMVVLRGVQDIPAFDRGMNNTTTARALATVLEAVARCETGDVLPALQPLRPSDCARITDVLAAQELTAGIPAGIPAGIRVANKTGSITAINHDAGIVYPPGRAPYVLVILTRGVADRAVSGAMIRDLAGLAWEQLVTPLPVGIAGPAELAALHGRYRVPGLEQRTFNHAAYWAIVDPVLEAAPHLRRERIGESVEGRSLNAVYHGHGPVTVLLWSQMHGDEPTATMALADILAFLGREPHHPLARRLAEHLTIVAVPMLNPDGAQRFQRRNALGIDINRDARAQTTPEARALKSIRDRTAADFGFNLHDQNVRTRVGDTDNQAAMAFLAPPWGESRDDDHVRERAARVAGLMRLAVDSLVEGRLSRYDDSFNPRAFGDLMQQWGTSTVLVESGGWDGDPEKQHLRLANFVGILAALDGIASGAYAEVSPHWYRSLPFNGRPAVDLILHGGSVVLPGGRVRGVEPYRADVAVQYADASRWIGPRVDDVGDLAETVARRSLDVEGLYVHLEGQTAGPLGPVRRVVVRRGPDPDSPVVWVVGDGGPVRQGDPAGAGSGP
jgi:beta-lactamase class A